ncbi:MAG: GldG family protein [Planctomycetes bacterium]|nr:GldG family protein [Planctomycetota bacterium]
MALGPGEQGPWTRLSIGARVVLAAVLALVATVLVTWVAERSALRWRADLTADAENTLHPATSKVLAELPREIEIDLFFSLPDAPFQLVGREVQDRVRRLARLFADQSGGRVRVEDHDLSDRTRLAPRSQARRHELGLTGIEPGGLAAVSAGGRRQLLRLRGDFSDLDPGNADPRQGPVRPPRVAGFRGEEALLAAILKVSEEHAPLVVFTKGHGELDLESSAERGAALLVRELLAQGFRTRAWDGNAGAPFPADADLAVVLGAEQRFTAPEFEALADYVERGGRLLVALSPRTVDGAASVEELLGRFGARPRPGGIVCTPMPSATGALQTGIPQCAYAVVGHEGMPAQNPVTDPLRTAGQRVMFYASRAVDRAPAPRSARVLDLLRSSPESWFETPAGGADRYDYAPDPTSERTRFTLAMQVVFPPEPGRAPVASGDPARPEARVLAVGSVDALANHLVVTNRDFIANAFDWLASREYRVRVDSREREARRLDLADPAPVARVHTVAVVLLPGLCVLLGLATWRKRRSTR